MLLQKKTYNKVVKGLEHYKKQHQEDRAENPNAIPIGWGSSIRAMITRVCREEREQCDSDKVEAVLAYLVSKGLLVDYCGDFTFPGEALPSKDEIIAKAKENLRKMGITAQDDDEELHIRGINSLRRQK
jgi:hypothetical protein